jgi:predicted nucleic acid-binding Zn ribbon protein
VTEPSAECRVCGAPIPRGARFCPSCGTPVAEGDTVRTELPPSETGPVPVTVQQASPRWFGLAPPTVLFGLAAALFVVAVVLLATGMWVAGLLVLGLALLFAAGFLEAGRRKPDAPVVRASVDPVDTMRARAGFRAQAFLTRSSARREIGRRRAEAFQLSSQRERMLRDLGAAVYAGGDGAAEREQIEALDKRVAGLEREAAEIAEQAQNRVEEARLHVQPTEVRKPAQPD